MQDTIKDRWMKLCEQASHEMDSAKLMEIVKQINSLMDEEERATLASESNQPGKRRSGFRAP